MNLGFTIREINSTHDSAVGYRNKFEEAIQNLDAAVNELASYWTSGETGTYEEFKELYNRNKKTLQDARDYMNKFIAKLEEKSGDFEEAASQTISNFQA